MRRENGRRVTALLLALLLPALGACGAKKTEKTPEDSADLAFFSPAEDYGREGLLFSNMLFPDSALSGEQRALIDSVQKIVDAAVFTPDSYTLALENTCDFPIDGRLYMQFLDSGGRIISENSIGLNVWEPGMRMEPEIDSHFFGGAAGFGVMIEFHDDEHWYRTAFREIAYEKSGVEIVFPHALPQSITFESRYNSIEYRLDEIETFPVEGGAAIVAKLTKRKGLAGNYDEIWFRLTDENGLLTATDSSDYYMVGEGEKIRIEMLFTDLEPGRYTLDIAVE